MSESDAMNSALNEFAGLWLSRSNPEPPDLPEFLRKHPGLTPRQITEICIVDQNHRWGSGQPRIVEQYLADVSKLAEYPELILKLVINEYLCRQQLGGELPDVHSFCLRFPDLSDALQSQLVTLNEPASSPTPVVYPNMLVTPSKLESLENALPPRFHFQKIIASGAFGVVVGAHDTKLDRVVALKIPLANLKNRRDRETFRADALALAKLDHPHIVPLFDLGELLDGRCFLVMKLVTGQDLEKRMWAGPASVDQVKAWLIPIAEALHHAHQKGITHRDVKPANILIDESGTPYLTDFGLAITDEQQRVVRHERAGSLSWMSPEQVRGESHLLDGRADIWSLGVVLYQALTRQLPFQGQTSKIIQEEILYRAPKPPRQLNDAISPKLEQICLRCLETSTTKRFTTALDLANALRDDRLAAVVTIPEEALKVVSLHKIEQDPFPVYQVTLHNLSHRAVILTELKVDVSEFQPCRHVMTRELVPTSRWHVTLPAGTGLMFHKPRHPILIAADDAAILELRLSCIADRGGACHPAHLGRFRLRFTFYAGAGIESTTEDITIGEIED